MYLRAARPALLSAKGRTAKAVNALAVRGISEFKVKYDKHVEERRKEGIVPKVKHPFASLLLYLLQ